ncbi:hypothetical protein DSECCO2_241920 [anaerobic digester metagenome]
MGVSFQDLNQKYNRDEFSPLDGELLHAADRLAAFIEAKLSLDHGIKSVELEEAAENIYSDYVGRKISGIDFGRIFNYFR